VAELRTWSDIAARFAGHDDVATGTWFGMACLKVGGKVFAALWQGDLVVKLAGEAHGEALQIPGARPFDPRGQGRTMREWVQIPADHSSAWSELIRQAQAYVACAAQAAKQELIDGLLRARREVLDAASLLSPPQQDQVFLGIWSLKDLLAHLAGWDDTNRRAVGDILAGRKPAFWEHYDKDWASYNALLVAEYRRDDWSEMLEVVRESHSRLIDYLESLPAEDLLTRGKIRTLLRTEIKDEREHTRQVERYVKADAP
jgi:hypothetical protein